MKVHGNTEMRAGINDVQFGMLPLLKQPFLQTCMTNDNPRLIATSQAYASLTARILMAAQHLCRYNTRKACRLPLQVLEHRIEDRENANGQPLKSRCVKFNTSTNQMVGPNVWRSQTKPKLAADAY